MDYFSYQVAPRWYRLYYVLTLALNVVLVALCVIAATVPHLHYWQTTLDFSTTTAALSGVYIAYSLSIYWILQKRSVPMATLVCSMLLALVILSGLSRTEASHGMLLYIVLWVADEIFIGFYGIPLLLGTILLTCVYILLESNFMLNVVSHYDWALLGATIMAGIGGYFLWRQRFMNQEVQAVNKLSGMLKNNQEQSEILIQSLADGVIVFGTDGKISLMNPAAAKMTEWPVNEAVGVDVQLVVKLAQENGSPLTEGNNPFALVLSKNEHTSQTLTLSGRDGKKQIISLLVSPVTARAGEAPTGAVAVMRDVSDQHAAEQQRGEFISTASHEMRTPVAAIEGYLALALNEKVSTIDSRARGYLEKAHTSTEHLGKLFQDLLTSSKAEDGRLSNHPAVVEMGAFMQQLTDDLKFAAEKKGLFAEFVIGASDTIDATNKDAAAQHVVKPLYYVEVDPDRMREVITNLFDNACKYTEAGKISIGLTGNGEVVQIYVRDTGAGIPADDIPHLFQKFYRVDNSATRTIGGTGLGLFICRKIVELYRGRIWVESELGKGSTFFINLPRLSTQRAQTLQLAETAAAQPLGAVPTNAVPQTAPPQAPTATAGQA
ncbi:MAG TPA: ATP-binding protein [Candidatus Saccharimonadales bacterium]